MWDDPYASLGGVAHALDDASFKPQSGTAVIDAGVRVYEQTISSITPRRWRLVVISSRPVRVIGEIGGTTSVRFTRLRLDDASKPIRVSWRIERVSKPRAAFKLLRDDIYFTAALGAPTDPRADLRAHVRFLAASLLAMVFRHPIRVALLVVVISVAGWLTGYDVR